MRWSLSTSHLADQRLNLNTNSRGGRRLRRRLLLIENIFCALLLCCGCHGKTRFTGLSLSIRATLRLIFAPPPVQPLSLYSVSCFSSRLAVGCRSVSRDWDSYGSTTDIIVNHNWPLLWGLLNVRWLGIDSHLNSTGSARRRGSPTLVYKHTENESFYIQLDVPDPVLLN